MTGHSPLLVGLRLRNPEAVLYLLRLDVDVMRMDPETCLTPLQLLFANLEFWTEEQFLEAVDALLKKGNYCFFAVKKFALLVVSAIRQLQAHSFTLPFLYYL